MPLPLSISGVAVLVNGVAAPLYYAAPAQLNVQIPYETTANNPAVLSINNNGQVTTQTFQAAAAAPGIFTDSTGALVPTPSAAPGQEIAFYITGAGAVSPAISDGAAPAASTVAGRPSETRAGNNRDHRRSAGNYRFHRNSAGTRRRDADQRASSEWNCGRRAACGGNGGWGGQSGRHHQDYKLSTITSLRPGQRLATWPRPSRISFPLKWDT